MKMTVMIQGRVDRRDRGGKEGELGNGKGETWMGKWGSRGRRACKGWEWGERDEGDWEGAIGRGQREGGQQEGEMGTGQRGGGEEGARRGGISQMDIMKCSVDVWNTWVE